uniref:glutathione S-transferase N-terminal domain-containing protein n=1 Tax=Pandoraea pnomenusa TaxID=93220 RepID=UPI0003FA3CAE|nr:glutathione S-transferase N-terminal domain-containing protein [Pandoraea pnomenusa]
MITLYDHPLSGNCHKVRLLMSMLDLTWQSEFVDVPNEAHHAPWYGEINPLREIPAIDDDGHIACDSQAILTYLAWKHDPAWLGDSAEERGRVVQWLSLPRTRLATACSRRDCITCLARRSTLRP